MGRMGLTAIATVLGMTLAATAGFADVIRIGVSAPKSGPQAGAAGAVYWPSIELWAQQVNEAGGIDVGGEKMPVELVEYDDKSTPEEAVKNMQRLITQDQVDFIAAPYTTGINLATAALIAKAGYPQIVATGNLNELEPFVAKWPNSFWLLGRASDLSTGIVGTMTELRDAGKIGNRIALVHVADAFGLEMMASGKPAFEAAGFEVVYETSYPLGTQDLAPVVSGAMGADVDAFVAYSYPPDSFALTEQAQVQGFNPKVFYVGVGGALTGYGQRFGAAAEGIMAMGGVNSDDPSYAAFREKHIAVTGVEPDYWASPVVYASMEILAQAITTVGSLDRAAVIAEIQTGTFETAIGTVAFDNNIAGQVWTVGQWQGGVFHGINAVGFLPAAEPFLKPAWSN